MQTDLMDSQNDPDQELILRAEQDSDALNTLFQIHRPRLREMIRLRINPLLRRRIDESDIVQDVLSDATKNFSSYAASPQLPFYIWLRNLAALKLTEVHRRHLTTQKRSIRNEVSLNSSPTASSINMVNELASLESIPVDDAVRNELLGRVRKELDGMDDIDREVLALRHFEQLSVSETARILGLSKAGAGSRYLRALKRLGNALSDILSND